MGTMAKSSSESDLTITKTPGLYGDNGEAGQRIGNNLSNFLQGNSELWAKKGLTSDATNKSALISALQNFAGGMTPDVVKSIEGSLYGAGQEAHGLDIGSMKQATEGRAMAGKVMQELAALAMPQQVVGTTERFESEPGKIGQKIFGKDSFFSEDWGGDVADWFGDIGDAVGDFFSF